jgi:8-oxo-dGTP pyrophosphatase MutT (NUDIX family)
MRALMQIGYRVRRLLLRVLRIRTRGVKVMVFNAAGELLLVRNGYGDSRLFVLPGGGIGRSEEPSAAAAREVREETGLDVRALEPLGTYLSTAEGKRDTIHLFRGSAEGEPLPDGVEVEEAAFFPLDALPAATSAATLRRVAELDAGAPDGGAW